MERLAEGDPRRIGAYRLLARLGAGGMGRVYLARSDRGRTVAVKLVREELAEREEFRERFRQEVGAARRVGGYWTAPVLDADTEAAVPWVATGYVAGPSLQQVVGHDHGALPERSVRVLGAGLAHALKDIHAAGIVHRDLKPSNVLVTIDGPRVIDFGIARALESGTAVGMTLTGAFVGSPGFMAPEQVRGEPLTPACDVFCLGSVLAYAATGALPFGTADSGVHALMFRIAQEEPDLTGVPEGIADLVGACLRKDPAARPSLDAVLARTGARDAVADGRSRDPWLPGALVAQLGRHAAGLLDTEDPEAAGPPTPGRAPAPTAGARGASRGASRGAAPGAAGGGAVSGVANGAVSGAVPGVASGAVPGVASGDVAPGAGTPAPGAAGSGVPGAGGPPPPGQPGQPGQYGQPGAGAPVNHLPTVAAGQSPPVSPPVPGYGYGYPQPPHGAAPPFVAPPAAPSGEPARRGPSTVLLVAVALVVALAAGGSVYALMNGDGDDGRADGRARPGPAVTVSSTPGPGTSGTPDTTGPSADAGPTTAPAAEDGVVPAEYLGTWTTTIDNATGTHRRRLTVRQGEVGDTVLSLVADGDTYHCVFQAELAADPGGDGPLRFGPSEVTVGEPSSSCTPGSASEATLLSDGRLERVLTSDGKKLTFSRE
ncbi:serine/threonine-protein kinase [Streptomyces sp. enrichment culture]|uniref:serine/threonine-protein kinase n=1 Tax=Streptomyces sp. enrichment culture TaxID=1795815 RepID=UPI003F54AF63